MNNSKSKSKSRPKTGNNNKTINKSRKISQKKVVSKTKSGNAKENQNNLKSYRDLLSPKTIEYSKIMDKYGDFLKDNSPKHSTERRSDRQELKNETNSISNRQQSLYTDDLQKKSNYSSNRYSSLTEYEKNINSYVPKTEYETSNRQIESTGKFNFNTINYEKTTGREKENSIKPVLEENEELKKENINLKKLLEREKSKSYKLEEELHAGSYNVLNVPELEKLKERINLVEKENEDLKQNQHLNIQTTADKIHLFLKLCSKYLKKIKNLVLLFSKLEQTNLQTINETKDTLLLELTQSIDKFNQTIHNPKLLNSLVDDNLDFNPKRVFDDIDEDAFFKHQFSLSDVVKKLEVKIKKLSEDNNALMTKKLELQTHADKLSEKAEEINRLNKKLNEEKLGREELGISLQYSKQMNKDLETKMNLLEEESNNLKKNMRISNEKLRELELTKNKNTNLENELRYKESIVNYLETLLKSNNISFSNKNNKLAEDKNYLEESEYDFGNNKFSKNIFKSDESACDAKNNNLNLKNFISPKDSFMNNNYDNNMKFQPDQSDAEYRFRPTYMDSPREKEKEIDHEANISKTSHLKNEIDNLDGEIKQLQNKLRIMIDVNKNK